MLDTIKDLKSRSKGLYAQARALDEAVTALQQTCEHDWKYTGHGHNSDYYVCTLCTKESND